MKLENDIIIPSKLEIDPYTYLDIKLKFEAYIKLIDKFGGYLFIQHLVKYSSKSEVQTLRDIHMMQDSKILSIVELNNYSYVLLSKSALKYLRNKLNVSFLEPPTSTQLKTCCYLAEYITDTEEFYTASKPYSWFTSKYFNEIQKYKNHEKGLNISFLNANKDKVKQIKEEENRSKNKMDMFSKLHSSKIYFDSINDGMVNLLILDFDRTKGWISKAMSEKIEPIFRKLLIYKGYDINILTCNKEREIRLKKDIISLKVSDLYFLKNIEITNFNTDRYFQSTKQKASFLKNVDKLEISALREKLKEGM